MMKKYLTRLFWFSFGIALFLIGYVFSYSLGQLDFYYKRISSPRQNSLVIGSSRSAQGIVPSIINDQLHSVTPSAKLYNFSFAASYSPYGEVYFNSIVKKIDPQTNNGIFILTVDQGSISGDGNELEIDKRLSFLAELRSVSVNPNLGYILNSRQPYWTRLLYNFFFGKGYLHDDGWLEMKISNDSLTRSSRLKAKLKGQYGLGLSLSDYRLDYLKKTVEFLKDYGDVYLVVLPNHPLVQERFAISAPWFNDVLNEISVKYSIGFIDFSKQAHQYEYTDGTLLTAEYAKVISKEIAEWIKEQTTPQ